MQTQTTASRLLALVFDGHSIRTVLQDGKPLFVAKDVFAAAEIKATRDAYRRLKDYERVSSIIDTLGGKQTMVCLTESGVYHVLFSSQKPAAENLRRWLADEVLPQLLTYGSYLPGATPAERLAALNRRVHQERAACVTASEASQAASGLMTLRQFRTEHRIPAQDILPIASRLQRLAKAEGTAPQKLTLPGHKNPSNAWPRPLLAAACNSTIPRLFLSPLQNRILNPSEPTA